MLTQCRLVTFGLVLALALSATAAFAGLITEQVDVTSSGVWPDGGGWYPSLSADGRYIAFQSWASNLLPGDANWKYDIFVRDRLAGVTHLVSLSESGKQADKDCLRPSLSADGATVAFTSAATTLVSTDTLGKSQIYLVQWQTGHVELVSVNNAGEVADDDCDWASVSGDGRYVAFQSAATNLTPDYNGQIQVYVRDRLLGTTICASRSSTGELSSLEALKPKITPDGRYVLFCAYAGNLVPGDTNNDKDIFLRDLQTQTTECISVSYLNGKPASGRSPAVPQPAITPDGRYVAFTSNAPDIVPGDTNGTFDAFVRDRVSGTTEIVSVNNAGQQGNDQSGHLDSSNEFGGTLAISADGRYVAFGSVATNLVPGDTNGQRDVFIRDRVNHTTTLASLSSQGAQGNGLSGYAGLAMSWDGSILAFDSQATNLVPGDTDQATTLHTYLRAPFSPTSAPTCEINGGDEVTSSKDVTLTIHANGWSYLHFRNETGSWSPWEAATSTRTWPLSDGDGVKLVSIQGGDANPPTTTSAITSASITLDTTIPTVTLTINGGAATTTNPVVTLTLTGTNAAQMHFRNEEESWSDWEPFATTKQWTLSSGGGPKTVTVQVKDLDGTLSAEVSAQVTLDLAPPGTPTLSIDGGATVTNNKNVTLTITSTNATQMRFRNETSDWSDWVPFAATSLWPLSDGDGVKSVSVQTRNAAGTMSDEVTAQITLDTTPPTGVSLAINGGAAATTSSAVTLTVAATDAVKMRFRNEAADWSDWMPFGTTATWTLSAGLGAKTVSVQVIDAAGNQSAAVSAQITLQEAVPTGITLVIDGGAKATNNATVTLTINAQGADEMRLKNETGNWSDWMPFATTTSWTLSTGDGTKTVTLEVRAGGGTPAPDVTTQIVLDTAPPSGLSITINGGATQTLSRTVTLTLAAAGAAQMRFRNESGDWSAWEPFATTKVWQLSADRGAKQVGFQVEDAAGNQSTIATAQIELANFPDVPSDFWAYSQIIACVDADIVGGYPDGLYHPEIVVTRDQMAVYIARALAEGDANLPTPPAQATFTDVPADYWAYKYVEYVQGQGIVQGYPDGLYHPTDQVDRGQMAVYIARSIVSPLGEIGMSHYDPPSTPTFPDVGTDFWSYKYVEYVKSRNIVQGYPDGAYHPEVTVTRDQMAVYVARAFQLPE